MPELPEVETVKRGLEKLIIGKKFAAVSTDNQKSFPNAQSSVDSFLIGASVISVRRRAKVLLIDLSSKYSLMIHLRMTGQIVYVGHKQIEDRRLGIEEPVSSNQIEDRFGAGHPSDSLVDNLPDKSTHVEFWFKDSSKLYFNDQRKFGWVKLLPTALIPEDPFMMRVGPEPLGDDLPAEVFMTRIKRRKGTNVKAAILDQTVLAGVGNIYADESLWAAKIHPATKVSQLSDNDLTNLRDEIVAVLQLAIDKGGSTDKNYVNAEGKKGSYIEFAKVFRREGQDCKRCGTTIDKIRVAGRGTHICKSCQSISRIQ